MKPKTPYQILLEDLPQKDRDWLGKITYPVNKFFYELFTMLNKGLTIKDNLDQQIFTSLIRITKDGGGVSTCEEIKITPSVKNTPQGVLVVKYQQDNNNPAICKSAVSADWIYDNGIINVRYISGLDSLVTIGTTATFKVTLLIIGG